MSEEAVINKNVSKADSIMDASVLSTDSDETLVSRLHESLNDVKEEHMSDEDIKVNELDISEAFMYDNCAKSEPQEMANANVKEEPVHMEFTFAESLEGNTFTTLQYSLCEECGQEYEGYCAQCSMLACILHNSVSKMCNNKAKKTIPENILEIRFIPHSVGVFALKTIPKGVLFGPCYGLTSVQTTSGSVWKIEDGKFKIMEAENADWMQYIACVENAFFHNLVISQHEGMLYYQSIQEINKDEPLIVYLDKECFETSETEEGSYYRPVVEDHRKSYCCTFCCLGFSSEQYLIRHKTKCPSFPGKYTGQEIAQCLLCKIYLDQAEYWEHHTTFCYDIHTSMCNMSAATRIQEFLSANTMNHYICADGNYQAYGKDNLTQHPALHAYDVSGKLHKCQACPYVTSRKDHLRRHLRIHVDPLSEKQYKCDKCPYETNRKDHLRKHGLVHIDPMLEKQYKCNRCAYETNRRDHLQKHSLVHADPMEKQHKCDICPYKTNRKDKLKDHLIVHTDPTLEKLHKCDKCAYATNRKDNLRKHSQVHADLSAKEHKCDINVNIQQIA